MTSAVSGLTLALCLVLSPVSARAPGGLQPAVTPSPEAPAAAPPSTAPRVPAPGPGIAPTGLDAAELARRLTALGPRPSGSAAQAAARRLLLAAMHRAGLTAVEVERGGTSAEPVLNLTGVLDAAAGGAAEILLTAHYDTVAVSPGAVDNAGGAAVVIAAASELGATPLTHRVRVVLFDGEERGLDGSRAWVAARDPAARQRVLAALNLDMVGWAAGDGPLVFTLPVERDGRRRYAPGWLVHAALRGSEAVGIDLAFLDRRWPLAAQASLRVAEVGFGADSDVLLAAGIPAILLTDQSPSRFYPRYHRPDDRAGELDPKALASWTAVVTATVRRLDGLAGRPQDEDRYLVLGDRVWLRRSLYWVGLACWGALVVTRHRRRSRAGRSWQPVGLAFRFLLLLAILVLPVLASLLLLPAAIAALVETAAPAQGGAGGRWRRWTLVGVGLAPSAALVLALAVGSVRGWVAGLELGAGAALLGATLGAFALDLVSAPASRPAASPERP